MLPRLRNTLVRSYVATRSDRGRRKEFVHKDKHRIRPCRQTERAHLRLGTSVNHPADPTTNMQRKKLSSSPSSSARSDPLAALLVPRHTYKQKITRKPSRNTFFGRRYGRFFFKTHLFRATARVARSRDDRIKSRRDVYKT